MPVLTVGEQQSQERDRPWLRGACAASGAPRRQQQAGVAASQGQAAPGRLPAWQNDVPDVVQQMPGQPASITDVGAGLTG